LRTELGFQGVVVSDDIGMHAVSRLFEDPAATVRLFAAGTDLMMVCSHWTDTDRCRGFAEALMRALRCGEISSQWDERSRARIHRLLALAPQNSVRALTAETFAAHREAGPLFGAATVEVV
jgi:beta-N-acetylhexosaminidase